MLADGFITLQPVRLGDSEHCQRLYFHCTDLRLVFFKLFKPLASFSYATLSSATFIASYTVSLELAEILTR